MMDEIYFFDLPVYRLSPQKYDLERESAIATERTHYAICEMFDR